MPKKPHPLTDEMCEILSRQPWLDPDVDVEGIAHDMRAAYDLGREEGREDRLKQVIEWLEDYEQVCGGFIRIAYFKQAMLPQPQQQQENN